MLPSLPFKKYLTTYRNIRHLKYYATITNIFFSYQLINIAETNSSLFSLQENVPGTVYRLEPLTISRSLENYGLFCIHIHTPA